VAALVNLRVVVVGMFAGRIGRDHSFGAALIEPLAQTSGIVGLVSDQAARCRDNRQQLACDFEIMCIASRQREGNRSSAFVGQSMDLGRAPAARAADRMLEGTPFAPAAEGCALMWVLSTEAVPTQLPVEPVSAKKISLHRPCRLQRLKRL